MCSHIWRREIRAKRISSASSKGSACDCDGKVQTLITSPIFYVNASPHIGHLYTALLCDASARWEKLKQVEALSNNDSIGRHSMDVIFSTGTDEHGLKVQRAAKKRGLSSKDFCDEVSTSFRCLFDAFDIQYDTFIRTTDDEHVITVKDVWERLMQSGHIYSGEHSGWYCESDEAFVPETQLVDSTVDGRHVKLSVESGHECNLVTERNYMFRLSSFEEPLQRWLEEHPDVIQPSSRYNEVLSFVSRGLRDISVSRPRNRVSWAVSVPNDPDQSVYVWLDALVNYLTVAPPFGKATDETHASWAESRCVQIVGKDILKFHSIYWPAFLMALNLPLPSKIVAHGHWTIDRVKMSKSIGNVVDPNTLLERYSVDAVRYFLLRDGALASDGDFVESALVKRYHSELADTVGNLLSRCTAPALFRHMLLVEFNDDESSDPRIVPTPSTPIDAHADDAALIRCLRNLPQEVATHFDALDFSTALRTLHATLGETNAWFAAQEPWVLAKSAEKDDLRRLATIIYITQEAVRLTGILLQPIIPSSAATLLETLGVAEDRRGIDDARFGSRSPGERLGALPAGQKKPLVLFRKVK